MPICPYFVSGKCRYGDKCFNLHVDVCQAVQTTAKPAIVGKQWPLSCFAPFEGDTILPNFIEDQSFEEVRSEIYASRTNQAQLSMAQQKFNQSWANAHEFTMKLINMGDSMRAYLINTFGVNGKRKTQQQQSSAMVQQSNPFGQSTAGVNTSGNIFGQPQVTNSSPFGAPAPSNPSPFGGGGNSIFGQQQQQTTTTNIFGGGSASLTRQQVAAKRLKQKSFVDTVAADLRMAIVNKADKPEWRLTEDQADGVEDLIDEKLLERAGTGAQQENPIFVSSGLIRGHILINCQNSFTKKWLINTVRLLTPTDKALRLDCIEKDKLPQLVVVRFATYMSCKEKVMKMLATVNSHMNLSLASWKIIGEFQREEKPKSSVRKFAKYGLKVAMPAEDVKAIEREGGLHFSTTTIPVRVMRPNEKNGNDDNTNQPASQ